jgi:lipoate---protein ligase
MFGIILQADDPCVNLALEEVLLKTSGEEYVILYINRPSVIIGKHQAAHREVNTKFVTQKNIPVIRRISGGGTVFHDKGNLNFSFIRLSESGRQVDFRKYTQPVTEFLISNGVNVRFEGKNDLKTGGFKISGNAEHVFGNRVLHHGTLLFNSSLSMLGNAIRKDTSCYDSRAVESNPSSVKNLNEELNCYLNIEEFRSALMNFLLDKFPYLVPYELSESVLLAAESLADSKYRTWEWNWAYGPDYTFINNFELKKISHSCKLIIKNGIITDCTIEGTVQMKQASGNLIGCRHMVKDLSEVFDKQNILLSEDEIYNFF